MTEKITNRQLLFIVFIMQTTVVLAELPVLTSLGPEGAGQDAWLSAILAMVGTSVLVVLIAGLGVKFPDLTIIEISEKLLGKFLGTLVSLVILWSFLELAATEVRVYSEMVVTGFLGETPILFLISVVVLVSVVAANAGMEVIARTVDLLFPLFIIILVFGMATLAFAADMDNLQPVMEADTSTILMGSITPIGFGAQLMVIGILIPHLNRPQNAVKSSLWGVIGASLILIIVSVLVVGVLGPSEGVRAIFPFFKAIRSVVISRFLERMEVLVLFSWGLGLFTSLSVFIYSGAKGVSKLFKVKNYRFLLLSMGVTWIVISMHISQDAFSSRTFFHPSVFGYYSFFLILFPYLTLWGVYLVKRLLNKI